MLACETLEVNQKEVNKPLNKCEVPTIAETRKTNSPPFHYECPLKARKSVTNETVINSPKMEPVIHIFLKIRQMRKQLVTNSKLLVG